LIYNGLRGGSGRQFAHKVHGDAQDGVTCTAIDDALVDHPLW